jgi:hypothetical protein
MKIGAIQAISILAMTMIALLTPGQNLLAAQEKPLELMMARIEEKDSLKGQEALYFKKLTPLLFEYLQANFKEAEIEPLYKAQTVRELGTLFEKQFGKNIIEFGEKMFAFFEEKASKNKVIQNEEWSEWTSEHFVFFANPGSRAEADIELIKSSAEETLAFLAFSLAMEEELAHSLKVLHSVLPEKNKKEPTKSFPGKIAVYLHQAREGEAVKSISRRSQGATSFGATITESGEEKGWGRLTAQINIFYFNAFSLAVLNHEVGHAVLFLESFDPSSLTKNPLKGESDLKKAFFAGYTPLSPFLHEGLGDYVIYYHGFYHHWPLLPQPEKVVQSFLNSSLYIPLKRLVKEDGAFRKEHHKEYSLEAASFLSYLIQTYGEARLKKWFLSGKDSIVTFEKIFDVSIEEMEKNWLLEIKKENNQPINTENFNR